MSTNTNSTPSARLEPVPDWSNLDRDIGHCWWMFTYGLGSIFCISLLFNISFIVWFRQQLFKHQHHMAVITGTMLCSFSIASFLIIDPYSRWRILPEVVTYLLAQLFKPSVILAFISVQNILIHMSSIRVKTNKFQSTPTIVGLFSVHLFTIYSIEVAIYFYAEFSIIRIVPEVAFMIMSSYSCLCYIYSGFKLTTYILDTKSLETASISKTNEISPEMCKSDSRDELQPRLRGKRYKYSMTESPSRLYNRLRRGQTVSTFILDLDSISTSSGSVLMEKRHFVCSKYIVEENNITADDASLPEVHEGYPVVTSSSVYQNESYDPRSLTGLKSDDNTTDPDIETSSKTSDNRRELMSFKASSKSLDSSDSDTEFTTKTTTVCSNFKWPPNCVNNHKQTCDILDEYISADVHESCDIEELKIREDTFLPCSNNKNSASVIDTNAIDTRKYTTDVDVGNKINEPQSDLNLDIGYLADAEMGESPGKYVPICGHRPSTYSVGSVGSTYAANYYQLPKRPPKTCSSFSLLRIRQSIILQKVVPVVYWVTFVMIVNIIFELYALFGVYGILGSGRSPKPWPWFLFQVLHRSVELMLVVMLQVAMVMLLGNRHHRRHRRRTKQQKPDIITDNNNKVVLP